MDAQPDCREVALPDFSTQLVKADPSTKHEVIDDLLVVGHVIDDPLKRRLRSPLRVSQLRDGSRSQGLGWFLRLRRAIFGFFARFLFRPETHFDGLEVKAKKV